MIKIGLIVAMEEESKNIYGRLGRKLSESVEYGYRVTKYTRNGKILYMIGTGIGELNAALATQHLIREYGIDYIINFGVVGSLNKTYKSLDVVAVGEIVHYDFSLNTLDDDSYGKYPMQREKAEFGVDTDMLDKLKSISPDTPIVKIASGDKFVAKRELRDWIINKFSADICDMESMGIYYAAKKYNVPCLFIKAVSDDADETAPVSFESVVENGISAYVSIVEKVVDGGHGLGVGGVAYGGAVSSGLQQSYKGSGVVGGVGHQTVHQCVERVLELVGGVCFVEFEVG